VDNDNWFSAKIALLIVVVLLALGGLAWGYPQYKVYAARQSGIAELAQADYAKQVIVVQAQAQLDSAKLNKESDIIRAQGTAAAQTIIDGQLTDRYIAWYFVDTLRTAAESGNGDTQIIYLPSTGLVPTFNYGVEP
jgi:regulator of protease activity HflC (stomatin/prohibitin superfamily)